MSAPRVAVLTRHGKERLLEPLFRRHLGARVELVSGFDTDTLGTFSGEVERAGSQGEVVRHKARLALELSGAELGVGSEGSFSSGAFGFGAWNLELVACALSGAPYVIVGRADGVAHRQHGVASSWGELEAQARAHDFPRHGLMLASADRTQLLKELTTWSALQEGYDLLRIEGAVHFESDLRAHRNPTRQGVIARAAEDLLQRLVTRCPRCAAVGFGLQRQLSGLPCEVCEAPTSQPRVSRYACPACDAIEDRPCAGSAPAQWCPRCNP